MIYKFSDIVESNGKTIRENNLSLQHKYPIDTLVEVKYDKWFGGGACEKVHARLFVVHHSRDCDGTPLYILASKPTCEWSFGIRPEHLFATNRTKTSEDYRRAVYARDLYGIVRPCFGEESLTPVEITEELVKGYNALQWEDE